MTANEGQPDPTVPETPHKLVCNDSKEFTFINH